jgi:hypothetical protein
MFINTHCFMAATMPGNWAEVVWDPQCCWGGHISIHPTWKPSQSFVLLEISPPPEETVTLWPNTFLVNTQACSLIAYLCLDDFKTNTIVPHNFVSPRSFIITHHLLPSTNSTSATHCQGHVLHFISNNCNPSEITISRIPLWQPLISLLLFVPFQ